MFNNWNNPNFPYYQGYYNPYAGQFFNNPLHVNRYDNSIKTEVKVAPINLNLTLNKSDNFTIKQPSKIYHTSSGQVIVPEINIDITFKNNNNIHTHQGYFRKSSGKFNSKKRNEKPFYKKKDGYNKGKNNQDNFKKKTHGKTFEKASGTSPLLPPGTKMIEIDLKSLDNSKIPFEQIIKKMLGLDTNNQVERKLEAPLSKELNFDLEKEYDDLPFAVKDLDGLISLADLYDKDKPHMYGFNMKRLSIIRQSLVKLNDIIGMKSVKTNISNKIITYLQGLGDLDDMNHIVIQAPPGYGKTMLGFHLSEIFYKLGLIKSTGEKKEKVYEHPFTGEKIDFPFIVAKRKDLIGQYVGHTAPKVEKVVEQAIGGVLFIDEAYSLGSKSKESFSDEAINTLNQLLSEKAGQFICIIAGYKHQLQQSFFTNPGLQRRFRMVFEIDKYTDTELALIFNKMVSDKGWKLNDKIKTDNMEKLSSFIKENRIMFKYCGGDMETFLQNVRDAHSLRVFGEHPKIKKIINTEDLKNGFKLFEQSTDRSNDIVTQRILNSLYY